MKPYDHISIEQKWQTLWEQNGVYHTQEKEGEKEYVLDMFPYPSGEGLHVGHPKGYIATDVYSRMRRMQGKNVLHPMGWDAFGLPAENYALKTKTHPRLAVEKNIARYKEQLKMIGFSYDWDREINTTDPSYYKWTQWIFLKLFEKGLAYQSFEPINWCPSCQTGLANEDVENDGTCERCGTQVEKRPMRQWVLKIRDYADRLLADLDSLDRWPDHIKEQQRNWIGKSEGAEIEFEIKDQKLKIKVFTTRPDTLFGATYMVLAPEHPALRDIKEKISNIKEVEEYIESSKQKTEIERTAEGKEKTGVELKGIKAINPATKEEIPIFVTDYVLAHYGTGAIMAVPAHDERDFEFAKKYGLPIRAVVLSGGSVPGEVFVDQDGPQGIIHEYADTWNNQYALPGVLIDSDNFTGLSSKEAKQKITKYVGGKITTTYRLQDWVFSRQRYWGEPIPIIHCEKCGVVPVPEKDLPVCLPEVENYEPSGNGESPLAAIEEWVNVPCPQCGGKAQRETNTMPQWAGSCWYYLRFMDPHNTDALVDPKKEKHWAPVDLYVGGAEHATRHLIYARFWHKFLYDIGAVSTTEPFIELHSVGLIQAEDGRKMSKRWGNVINPDDIVHRFGADSLRVYEMFMGPFENSIAWSTNGLVGARRFIERVWRLKGTLTTGNAQGIEELEPELHKTIKKVTSDITSFKFNTAVSQMMIFLNKAEETGIGAQQYETLLRLLAPFAPHVTEELWEMLGHTSSVHLEAWPQYDEARLVAETVSVAVQIGGKTRGTVTLSPDAPEDEALEAVRGDAKLARYLTGSLKKVIYVQGRVINIVV